ncbi:MAG: CHAT domain-containing protein [Crocinitomicaceae bacterium]|nr:CHAT domain-containing protein [Crocinitomicaceae bacterium]
MKKSLELYTEIADQRGIASTYTNLGILYRTQGKYKKAIEQFNQSYHISVLTGSILEKRNSLEGLFYTHFLQGEYDLAEKELLEIISMRLYDVNVNFEILPEQKKEFYLNTMSQDFMNLYSFADVRKSSNPSITETAYNNTLKLKGLLLKSTTAMRDAIMQSGNNELIEKYTQWIQLKTEISQGYAAGLETKNSESRANEIEKELIRNSMAFSEFKMYQQINWKDVQDKLSSDEAAIEFISFPSEIGNTNSPMRYAALVITPLCQVPEMIDLCTSSELGTILKTNQANNLNYVKEIYGTTQAPDSNLYKLIWAPLENELSDFKTIYFSPTGLFHKISFAALRNENNQYLCNRYNLIQVSSTAQITDDARSEFPANVNLSLFGGVKYSTEKTKQVIWNYLPGSLAEIDSIHSMLKNQITVNYYSQENASEENFKQHTSQSNFLHIATHGFFILIRN